MIGSRRGCWPNSESAIPCCRRAGGRTDITNGSPPEYGHPRLKMHMEGVTALMRAAQSWESFKRSLDRAYPKKGHTVPDDHRRGLGAMKVIAGFIRELYTILHNSNVSPGCALTSKCFARQGLTFKVLIHPFAGFWLRDTRPCFNNLPCCNFHGTFNGIGITAPAIEFTSVLLSCSVPCNSASVVAIGNNKLTFTGTFRNNELFTVNFDCAFVHDNVSILCPATYRLSGFVCVYLQRCVALYIIPKRKHKHPPSVPFVSDSRLMWRRSGCR